MGRNPYEGLGIPPSEIKKIQIQAAEKVEKKQQEIKEALEEKRRQREFKEGASYKGMTKDNLVRSSRAKK